MPLLVLRTNGLVLSRGAEGHTGATHATSEIISGARARPNPPTASRCRRGAPEPATLEATSECDEVRGVGWFIDPDELADPVDPHGHGAAGDGQSGQPAEVLRGWRMTKRHTLMSGASAGSTQPAHNKTSPVFKFDRLGVRIPAIA